MKRYDHSCKTLNQIFYVNAQVNNETYISRCGKSRLNDIMLNNNSIEELWRLLEQPTYKLTLF